MLSDWWALTEVYNAETAIASAMTRANTTIVFSTVRIQPPERVICVSQWIKAEPLRRACVVCLCGDVIGSGKKRRRSSQSVGVASTRQYPAGHIAVPSSRGSLNQT